MMSDELEEYAAAAAQGEVFDFIKHIVELTTRVQAQATIIRDQGGWLAEAKAKNEQLKWEVGLLRDENAGLLAACDSLTMDNDALRGADE
jgi:hypothetical protein